jgi:hypothetical protein
MPKKIDWQREEDKSLHMMAKGLDVALEGLLKYDNVIHYRAAQPRVLRQNKVRQETLHAQWQRRWKTSLRSICTLVDTFQQMRRIPQFSPLKKKVVELLMED